MLYNQRSMLGIQDVGFFVEKNQKSLVLRCAATSGKTFPSEIKK